MNDDLKTSTPMEDAESAIQTALQTIPEMAKAGEWNDTLWTKTVKEAIVGVGNKNGYKTSAKNCDGVDTGEWLYDVVWWKYDDKGCMADVPLVAESEWGNMEKIKSDFEKLLVSRSKFRVMVFQAGSEESVRDRFKTMRQWIKNFGGTNPGDRYLLAGWTGSADNQFLFDPYVVE